MKLNSLELLKFLPLYMQDDLNAQGFAYTVQRQLDKIILLIDQALIYGRVEELSSEVLDELAWQFNIPEYNSTFSLEVKRTLISQCMLIHQTRGTVAAVEKVITDVFGVGWVEEWFDYATTGDPYHFNVHTTNPIVTDELHDEFIRVLTTTKNLRSVLDEIIVDLVTSMNVYHGAVLHMGQFIAI